MYAAQIANYLGGEAVDPFNEHVSGSVRALILQISKDLPEIADNLMKQDTNLREIVVHTLRMRFALGSLKDEECHKSTQGRHIGLLLQLYGPEFPEEVDGPSRATRLNGLLRDRRHVPCA